MAHGGDDDVGAGSEGLCEAVQAGDQRVGPGEQVLGRGGVAGADAEAQAAALGDEATGHGRLSDDDQLGPGQARLQVDGQGSLAAARHGDEDGALQSDVHVRRVGSQEHQAGLAVVQGLQGLAGDDGLGAASADPAVEAAVRADDGLGPRLGRGGRLAGDDGGQDEGLAVGLQRGGPLE